MCDGIETKVFKKVMVNDGRRWFPKKRKIEVEAKEESRERSKREGTTTGKQDD